MTTGKLALGLPVIAQQTIQTTPCSTEGISSKSPDQSYQQSLCMGICHFLVRSTTENRSGIVHKLVYKVALEAPAASIDSKWS